MEDIKKEVVKKPILKKETTKEYVIKKTCLIGQKRKPLVKGGKISLTKTQAEAYTKNNII